MNMVVMKFGQTQLTHAEGGFGMIEIVVSMFLLGMLSISFIPLLINTSKGTGMNTTIATATQIVNQEIEGARAVRSPTATTPSCFDVTNFLQVTLAPVTDPGVVRARITVTRVGYSDPVASATTLIFVQSA